jgi:hypothetical protein
VTSNEDSRVAGTHDSLGERAILAGKNKDVEDRNNIIQSVTGKGHCNAWPGTASIHIYNERKPALITLLPTGVVTEIGLLIIRIREWGTGELYRLHFVKGRHSWIIT